MASWISRLFSTKSRPLTERRTFKPKLESLEDRTTPATFVVTNFTDSAFASGTLRDAIVNANHHPGADTITFAPSQSVPAQVRTINLNNKLTITDAVTIDGNMFISGRAKPGIELNGDGISSSEGGTILNLVGDGNTLRGLIVNRAGNVGITIDSDDNVIEGCFIGTTKTGNANAGRQNEGIRISGSNNLIGGSAASQRNIISGNAFGITVGLNADPIVNNTIQGNFLGLNAAGTASIPGGVTGIRIQGPDTSRTFVTGNVIAGFASSGIDLFHLTHDNQIQGNKIGTAPDGITPLGNTAFGVFLVSGANDNTIGGSGLGDGNVIAFSTQAGIVVRSEFAGSFSENLIPAAVNNSILGNQIFGSPLFIDLGFNGPTANDPLDADVGGNNLQNFPVLTAAGPDVTSATRVTGTFNSVPNTTYRLEFFSFTGQNMTFLKAITTTTDAAGDAPAISTNVSQLPVGTFVGVTATNLTTGDTSEFGSIVVSNTPPMIRNDVLTPDINEGQKATLSGNLVDPNPGDVLTLRVNWGDGSPIKEYHPGLEPFAFTHRYKDDGVYNVNFTWLDNHGGSNTRTRQVVVHNVVPELRRLDLSREHAKVHQRVVLSGRIVDPGKDTFTLTVNWGDGTVETIERDRDGAFRLTHRYRQAGLFTIQLTLADDDGGMTDRTMLINVG